MADTARRDLALAPLPRTIGPVTIRPLKAATRLILRVKGVDVPAKGALPKPPHAEALAAGELRGAPQDEEVWGFRPGAKDVAELSSASLALPINRCAHIGREGATVARLGPDEWLLVAPVAMAEALAQEVATALGGRTYSLVDVSHRQIAIEVAGAGADMVLNAGCPLDLHLSAFPPGSATRTLLGKAEIVLVRPTDAPAFTVECARSFAVYVQAFLEEAALDV